MHPVATIETITGRAGRVTYRVAWISGGRRGGARDSETCDTKTIARKFKALVEAAGERRPEGYPKRCRGLSLTPAEPEPEERSGGLALGAIIDAYLAALGSPAGSSRGRSSDTGACSTSTCARPSS
jgi:hypothetical protein